MLCHALVYECGAGVPPEGRYVLKAPGLPYVCAIGTSPEHVEKLAAHRLHSCLQDPIGQKALGEMPLSGEEAHRRAEKPLPGLAFVKDAELMPKAFTPFQQHTFIVGYKAASGGYAMRVPGLFPGTDFTHYGRDKDDAEKNFLLNLCSTLREQLTNGKRFPLYPLSSLEALAYTVARADDYDPQKEHDVDVSSFFLPDADNIDADNIKREA